MNANLNFDHPRPSHTVAAAALATVIALSLFWAVATLFQSRGEPFAELAAAERACATYDYQSDREACMKRWVAENGQTSVARR